MQLISVADELIEAKQRKASIVVNDRNIKHSHTLKVP